jgi:LysM repeat protein
LCLAKQGFTPYPIVQCANKYTIVAGDTCDTISFNTKVALGSIFSYNPGLDCTALQPGQEICLDNAANVIIPNCTYQYTVQIGDTCNSIAAKVGISYTSLIALNKVE